MSASKRDLLRKATVGAKSTFRSEQIKYGGQIFEIRQPSIKARAALRKRCNKFTIVDGEPQIDFDAFEFLTWGVIKNTFVPGTNERVFDDEDYDTLVAGPAGGFMDTFGEIAAELINVEGAKAKKPSTQKQKAS